MTPRIVQLVPAVQNHHGLLALYEDGRIAQLMTFSDNSYGWAPFPAPVYASIFPPTERRLALVADQPEGPDNG